MLVKVQAPGSDLVQCLPLLLTSYVTASSVDGSKNGICSLSYEHYIAHV